MDDNLLTKASKVLEHLVSKGVNQNDEIAIIGGNSLLKILNFNEQEVTVEFEFQSTAFELALILNNLLKEKEINSTITVVFDQSDSIKYFLGFEPIKNSKGNPKLDANGNVLFKRVRASKKLGHTIEDLHANIKNLFLKFMNRYGVFEANQINVLFESYFRSKIMDFYNNQMQNPSFPDTIIRSLVKERNCFDECTNTYEQNIKIVPSCKAITSSCFSKVLELASKKKKVNHCVAIWGKDDVRCNKNIIEGGAVLTTVLFNPSAMITNIFLTSEDKPISPIVINQTN